MRTTLKRGTCLAQDNGAPSFPPSPLTPVTRYRTGRRSRLRVVGKILFWTLLVLLVAVGGLAGGVWLWFTKSVEAVSAQSPEAKAAEEELAVPTPGEPTVAMVIGYDSRQGADKGNPPKSDTIMLLRADPAAKTLAMLSFPRDLVVDIPGCRGQPPYRERINDAFTTCGPRGTLKTVKQLTGIRINYLITVNFRSFVEIVNELGGVYLDIDRRYFNDRSGPGGYAKIDLHPGYQRLDGPGALSYVRYRHTDSDLYRNARQQEFVKAVKQQVSSFWSISKLPGIVNTITHNVEVGVAGGKTLDAETVLGYAKLVYELPAGNFHQARIENLTGYYELSASEAEIDAAVERFLNPDAAAAEKATEAATGGTAKKRPRAAPPSSVTLEVLNGNGIVGSADEAAYLLGKRGYQVTTGGNADNFDYFETKVLYDPDEPRAEAAAKELAQLFGDAEVEAAPAGELSTMLRVVVGQTFTGTLGPGPADRTPKHEPPDVVRDPSLPAAVRRAAGKVDFPLLVPTLREASSRLADEEPVRAYRLEGHDAVRIVFNGPEGIEYWGVQQTGWTDAPVLDGPSLTRTIGGREYRLFYNGPHLHVVAFEENGAAYWVTNTLLDAISNETMLAIAKALQPVAS